MEQSSLQGVDPVPAREARQQGVITGECDLRLAKKENDFTGETLHELKGRGEALKRKERYGVEVDQMCMRKPH